MQYKSFYGLQEVKKLLFEPSGSSLVANVNTKTFDLS